MTNSAKLPFDIKVRGEGRIITPEEKARASVDDESSDDESGDDEPDNG